MRESSDTIEVHVRTVDAGEQTLRISASGPSVLSVVKARVEAKTGVPVARQQLLYHGRVLEGDGSAVELGWGDMDRVTLHMVVGGGPAATAGAMPGMTIPVAGMPGSVPTLPPTDPMDSGRGEARASGNVLHDLFRTLTGGDQRSPVAALQEVAAAFGVANASTIMDFVEGFLNDLSRSVQDGLQAAATQLRSEARTEAMAPSVEMVNEMIGIAMPEITIRMREAMKTHLSFLEHNRTPCAREAAAASAAEATAANVVPEPPTASALGTSVAAAPTVPAPVASKPSAKPSLPQKKKAPGGLGLGGGLKKKPAAAKGSASAASSSITAAGPSSQAGANTMQQMMGMLSGGGGGANALGGLLGGLMGGKSQQPEPPLDVDEVLANEIQVEEERIMWRKTIDQMESMAAARGSNGAQELPPLGDVYLAAIPDTKSGGSALDQIFDI